MAPGEKALTPQQNRRTPGPAWTLAAAREALTASKSLARFSHSLCRQLLPTPRQMAVNPPSLLPEELLKIVPV